MRACCVRAPGPSSPSSWAIESVDFQSGTNERRAERCAHEEVLIIRALRPCRAQKRAGVRSPAKRKCAVNMPSYRHRRHHSNLQRASVPERRLQLSSAGTRVEESTSSGHASLKEM